MDAIVGRFVWSKAGRDKDKLFIIIDLFDEAHVLVSDGDLRPVEHPKKKKLKHLKVTGRYSEDISQSVLNQKRLTNADLRKAIEGYMNDLTTLNKGEEV